MKMYKLLWNESVKNLSVETLEYFQDVLSSFEPDEEKAKKQRARREEITAELEARKEN